MPCPTSAYAPQFDTAGINARVGAELSVKTIKRALDDLVATGAAAFEGERRWRRYRLAAAGPAKGQAAPESPASTPRDTGGGFASA